MKEASLRTGMMIDTKGFAVSNMGSRNRSDISLSS